MLILGTAFFVAAEYSLVASRRTRLEALSRRGQRSAKGALKLMDDPAGFIAVGQLGISMLGIGLGTFTEPYLSAVLVRLVDTAVPPAVSHVVSIVLVTYLVVVIGELSPKYLALKSAERVFLATYRPMQWLAAVLKPLIWLTHYTTAIMLRPFGIDILEKTHGAIPKEELLVLIKTGSDEGLIDRPHAEIVSRALKIDQLVAHDIMIHRLDMKWVDSSVTFDDLLEQLKGIPYGRVPVCKGDIDEVVGIVYLHDVVKRLGDPAAELAQLIRPPVLVPENLSMDRIVQTMREQKTQILIVTDEYGGTSGLITLEDVVEEVFGELEDKLESERPPIETLTAGRVSARADVRLDELVTKLGIEIEMDDPTRTLAQIVVDSLDRVPRPGDSVETPLGILRVDNMARRRITRVSLRLRHEHQRS